MEMRIAVFAFHPESSPVAEARVRALFPGQQPDFDYIYPSVEFSESDVWDDNIAADIKAGLDARFSVLTRPIRVVHVRPAEFMKEALGARPPALVVIAYTHWSERVAMTANMLAMRQFPTLILGYTP